MLISKDHINGFLIGVGVSALGFYVYKKNQVKIDGFLRQQGINLPVSNVRPIAKMTIEELVTEKERLEDLIAEKEMAQQSLAEAANG